MKHTHTHPSTAVVTDFSKWRVINKTKYYKLSMIIIIQTVYTLYFKHCVMEPFGKVEQPVHTHIYIYIHAAWSPPDGITQRQDLIPPGAVCPAEAWCASSSSEKWWMVTTGLTGRTIWHVGRAPRPSPLWTRHMQSATDHQKPPPPPPPNPTTLNPLSV